MRKKLLKTALSVLACIFFVDISRSEEINGHAIGVGIGYSKIHTPKGSIFVTSHDNNASARTHTVDATNNHGGRGVFLFVNYGIQDYIDLEVGYNVFNSSNYESHQVSINKSREKVKLSNVKFSLQTDYNVRFYPQKVSYKYKDKIESTHSIVKLKFTDKSYSALLRFSTESYEGIKFFAKVGFSYVVQDVQYSAKAYGKNKDFKVKFDESKIADYRGMLDGSKRTIRLRPTIGLGVGIDVTSNVNVGFFAIKTVGTGDITKDVKAIPDLDTFAMEIRYTIC